MDERLPGVMTEIRSLLDVPVDAEPPPRALVEHTLTSGYACALALESRKLRLESGVRAAVCDRAQSRSAAATEDPSELMRQLAETDQQLAGLRALLSRLRVHALR